MQPCNLFTTYSLQPHKSLNPILSTSYQELNLISNPSLLSHFLIFYDPTLNNLCYNNKDFISIILLYSLTDYNCLIHTFNFYAIDCLNIVNSFTKMRFLYFTFSSYSCSLLKSFLLTSILL